MTITHHPDDDVLAAYAAGTLDDGSAFVIAAHLAMCGACRSAVRDFECIGGVLLGETEPSRLGRAHDGAVMQELAAPQELRRKLAVTTAPDTAVDNLISIFGQSSWKWRGFGVHSADIGVPVDNGMRVFLLKAAAGTRMPQHTHSGVELTLVLKGAFQHEFGRFEPGDIEMADGDIDHRPIVDAGSECVCLVAMNGRLQLHGLVGRLLQPFVRI